MPSGSSSLPQSNSFKLLAQSNKDSEARQKKNMGLMSSALTASSPTGGAVSSDSIGGAASALPVGGGGGGNAAIIAAAKKYIGVPYVAGGRTPKSGMDCSGYTAYVLKEALGITVPALSGLQAQRGAQVSNLKSAQPGDLLFFDLGPRDTYKGIDHVAVYLGNGKMIEAPRPGKNIGIVSVYHTPKFIRRYG